MNYSTEGGTAPPTAVHRLPRSQGIAYVAAFVVESLVIIIVNLVVLAVFGKNRQLRQRKSHWLLINQAVADLLAGFIIGPFWVDYLRGTLDLRGSFYSSMHVFIAGETITSFLIFASFFNLLMIALERTCATFRPIKHRALSAKNHRVTIVVVWFLPVPLTCLCAAHYLGIISLPTYLYILTSSACGMFLLVVFSYASVWIKFKCRTIHPQNDLRAAQERKLTASVFLVTAASFIAFLSGTLFYVVGLSLQRKTISRHSAIHVSLVSVLLFCANFLINPIIYSLKMPGFRRAAIRLIWRSRPRTANAALPLRTVQRNRENLSNGRL